MHPITTRLDQEQLANTELWPARKVGRNQE